MKASTHTLYGFFLLFILLPQMLFASPVLTEEEKSYVSSRGPVRAVSVDGSGPIQYIDSRGTIKGISIRILEEISRKTGLVFEYKLYKKITDAGIAYADGTDIIFGIPDQYARPGYTLSRPFLTSQTIFFATKGIQPYNLEDKRFAATLSSALPEGVEESQAIYYQSREEAIKAVNTGEADFGYGNAYSLAFYTLRFGLQNIYTVPQGKEDRFYRILFIKDDPLLVSIVDKALSSLTPQELQSIALEATSQVERIVTAELIFNMYGKQIFFLSLGIISLLLLFLILIIFSRVKLDTEKRKYRTISEVANEYLFEYHTNDKSLILYEKFSSLFPSPSSLDSVRELLLSHLAKFPLPAETQIIPLQLPGGESKHFKISARLVPNRRGSSKTWIGKLHDITEEMQRQTHLKTLAQTDGLTGVVNAATTRQLIEYRLLYRPPDETDFCILIDLDNFKLINDTMGHLAGDEVLKSIAGIISQEKLSERDIVGRVGGDEFCIYLFDIDSRQVAVDFCASVLKAVQTSLSSESVTVSMGGSVVDDDDSYEMLYARVDLALYAAKGKGKNNCEIVETKSLVD